MKLGSTCKTDSPVWGIIGVCKHPFDPIYYFKVHHVNHKQTMQVFVGCHYLSVIYPLGCSSKGTCEFENQSSFSFVQFAMSQTGLVF